jgi:polysaccharide export outer membrane protein
MKNLKVVLLIVCMFGISAAQEPTFQERHPRYRIHAGDVIAFNFSFTPDFNQTVTVQPDVRWCHI